MVEVGTPAQYEGYGAEVRARGTGGTVEGYGFGVRVRYVYPTDRTTYPYQN